MENVFPILLTLHIAGGSLGLVAGTINIFRIKGDRYHQLIGNFFFYGMLVAASAALAMSVIHPRQFLFIVGVFTIYLAATGKRYLSHRDSGNTPQAKPVDWALTIAMGLFSAAFIGFGIYNLINGKTFGLVFIAFGFISARMVRTDVKNYQGKADIKNTWFVLHLQRMMGAYVAALTAFLVVNLPQGKLPAFLNFIPWLMPTLIITPFILKWTKKYQIKKKEAQQ